MHEVTKRVEGTFDTVSVKFLNDMSNRCYTYKVPAPGSESYSYHLEKHLKAGAMAVVQTNTGYKLVEVVELHDTPQIDYKAKYEYRWLVDVVNTTDFIRRGKFERKLQREIALSNTAEAPKNAKGYKL